MYKGYCIFLENGSYVDIITVQAPQPPVPQPYFVPVRWTERTTDKEEGTTCSYLIQFCSICPDV